jgi:hypothetical protein
MSLYKDITLPQQLKRRLTEAEEYKDYLEAEMVRKTTQLNLIEELKKNVLEEYQFRCNRVVQAMRNLRDGIEDIAMTSYTVRAIGQQILNDEAQMNRISAKLAEIQANENKKLDKPILKDLINLSQTKRVRT